jgi:hypothetical protein
MIEFVSLNSIKTDLLTIIRGAKVTQSETISTRQIEKWVHEYRALLLKRDLDKNKFVNPDYVQEIPALELEQVDVGEGTTINTGVYIYRTKLQLPKTIDLNYKSGFTSVSTLFGVGIQLIPQSRFLWQKYKKYTSNDLICYLNGRYLYVQTQIPISFINVRGIFEVPPEVDLLVNPQVLTSGNYDEDTKYPIPINMVPVLKELILKQELGILYKQPSDNVNDSNLKVQPNIEQQ